MAVLGFHVVVTLIALTVFTKLKARFSFCHYLVLKGLYYFTPPSTYELREISGKRFPEKKRRKNIDDTEPFNIPKDSEFRVLRLPLQAVSLDGVPFFDTLCFVFDYLIFAFMVFTISETFVYFFPENRDTNVSVVWLFIAAAFMLQALVKLTASNIGSVEVSDERNLIFSFCAISFLFCTIFTMWCDKITDIEFNEGYKNFTKIVSNFLKEQQFYSISNYEAKSPILLYIFLSVMFSAISSMLLFPSLRYATMYIQAIRSVGKLKQLLIHFTFFLPLFILTMFTKPVKEQFVSERFPWITESRYEIARIVLIIIWALLRVAVAKAHLQAFLNTAQQKVITLRKESGFIKSDQLQKMIIRYAQYFCAAALQYYVPVFLTAVVALILKNLGDIDFVRIQMATSEVEDSSSLASLKILLNFSAQKAFWSYCIVMLLIVNVTLTVFGTIYSYNFMADQNLVYGIDVHSRSLTAFPAEENRTIFMIASYTLKNDSKVFLLEADDRWSRINGNGYNFDRTIGEILHMDAHPQIKKLTFAECSFKLEGGKPVSGASICELDESSKIVKTLSSFTPKDPLLRLLRTEFQANGDRLALLGEDRVTICDIRDGGKEMKESWSHDLPGRSMMNAFAWDKHSSNGNGLYASSGSEVFFFDTRTDKKDLVLNNGFHRISSIACNPLSSNRIAVGSEEGRIALWDTRKCDGPITFKFDHQYRIWDLKYNHTYEKLLISCAGDGRVILYNLENADKEEGKIESELILEAEDSVYGCAWAGSDPFIFGAIGYDGRLTASKVRKSLKYKLLQGN